MKIACIVSTFPPIKGGIGNVAYNFSHVLARGGHEVTVFTPRYYESLNKNENLEKNLIISRLKPFFKFGNSAVLPQLIFLLKEYDIIYLHYPFFGAAEYVMLSKLFFGKNKKLIIQYHMDNYAKGFKGLMYFLYKIFVLPILVRLADVINVATFDYIQSTTLKKYYDKKSEKFRETYYGVDVKKFSTNYTPTEKRLLFVGGMDSAYHSKGLDVLLGAIKLLKEKYQTEVRLDIIGNGNQKESFMRLARKLEIHELINFTHNVEDGELSKYLRDSTALVLPAKDRGEAFGIVLLEAMASGKPVIASNLAGVRSVFEDKKHGLLSNPNDIIDLAEKIKYIWDNPEIAKNMGREARQFVENKYDLSVVGKNINKIFNEVIKD